MTKENYFGTYGEMKRTVVGGIGTVYDGKIFVSHVGGMPILDNSNKNKLEEITEN